MSGMAFIALGGNLGDVKETMQQAVCLLDESVNIEVVNCSGVYRTSPVGTEAGETFHNGIVCVQTLLNPEKLLLRCHEIEDQLGRVREIQWGPRTIDLDLIAYEDLIIQSATLSLPHPACWYRRFVLDPMTEIAADWVHPERKTTIVELQTRLLNRPLILDLSCCDYKFIPSLKTALEKNFSQQHLSVITDNNNATSEHPTWKVLKRISRAWEKNEAVSRLELTDLPTPTAQALVDVVRSALDAPQRITNFEFNL